MTPSEFVFWPPLRSGLFAARNSFRNGFLILSTVLFVALLCGCPSKTDVAPAPPPPPAPPAPTASIAATPVDVQAGEPVTVTWKTENAGEVNVAPFGAVAANGSQTIKPTETTTYRLTAKGPGGVQESSVTVTVATAAAEPSELPEVDFPETSGGRLDVFFDTDDFSIRSDQLGTIKNDADFLKQHPEVHIRVEGHCDELGSTEYNLALGERRAWEVKFALEKAGISSGRMETITYGKERPFCEEQSDECWRMNRRAHIVTQVAR